MLESWSLSGNGNSYSLACNARGSNAHGYLWSDYVNPYQSSFRRYLVLANDSLGNQHGCIWYNVFRTVGRNILSEGANQHRRLLEYSKFQY